MIHDSASRLRRGVIAFLFAGLAAVSARAGDAIEKSLPGNTFFLAKTDSVKQLKEAFSSSQMGQLWADPAMKAFKDKVAGMLEEPNAQIKEALGVDLGELGDIPQGQAALALVTRDDPQIPLALLVSIDAGDNAAKMADIMARLEKLAEKDEKAKIATEEAEGVTLHIAKHEGDGPPIVWTQSGSVFYLSTDVDALKDLIHNAKGREDSLAAQESFAQVVKKVGDDDQIFYYIDVNQSIGLITKLASANGGNGEQITAQIQLTGINGWKAMGGTFSFNRGEFDSESKLFFYAPAPWQGVLKLFSMPPTDLKPEPWVPANVSSYGTFSWEMGKFWGALSELVDQFAPGQLEQAEKLLSGPDGNGIDLKKDIFAPLGKRVSMISDYKKPVTENSQRIVFAIELSDATAAQNTLNKILTMMNADPKKRDFLGTTIYDFDLPAEAAASGLTGPISLTIAKDHLFFASEPTLLEQVLRGGDNNLAENSDFQEALKHMPSQVSMLSFDRPEDQVQVMYSMLNNEQFKTALTQLQDQNQEAAKKVEELFDPKILPDFKEIQKYFAPGGSYGVTSDDGLMITSFTLKHAK